MEPLLGDIEEPELFKFYDSSPQSTYFPSEDECDSLPDTNCTIQKPNCSQISTPAMLTDDFSLYESILDTDTLAESTQTIQLVPPSIIKQPCKMIFNSQIKDLRKEMMIAVSKNQFETLKRCIDQGGRVNSRGPNDYTLLHIAVNDGFYESAKTLIQNGADVNAVNYMERTPLHLACIKGVKTVVSLLLDKGADVNSQDIDQNTPAHFAAEYGHYGVLACLLPFNPDLSVRNRLNQTPLQVTISRDISQLFQEYRCRQLIRQNWSNQSTQNKTIEIRQGTNPNDYDVLQQLGKGSFGEVYLVRKRDTMENFAMKILPKEKMMQQNLMKYVITERNVLSYIRHPFIVGLNYAFQTQTKLCLILDYCPGKDLGKHLRIEGRFNEERARIYAAEVVCALEALHKRNIIFRDLKPENIVIDQDGHAMLTDFGLSKEGISSSTMARSFCGSVAYLAPEMLSRKGHGKTVDWYLLGILLFEMLTGTPPYYSPCRQQLFWNIQNAKLKFPKYLGKEAKDILTRLLERNPRKRLGAKRDYEEIKNHEWFKGLDWNIVYLRNLKPPLPKLEQIPDDIIPLEVIYGKLDDTETIINRLSNWTFISI